MQLDISDLYALVKIANVGLSVVSGKEHPNTVAAYAVAIARAAGVIEQAEKAQKLQRETNSDTTAQPVAETLKLAQTEDK